MCTSYDRRVARHLPFLEAQPLHLTKGDARPEDGAGLLLRRMGYSGSKVPLT